LSRAIKHLNGLEKINMSATIREYDGIGLFAANDNNHPAAVNGSTTVDPRVLLSLDVALFRCLRRLGTSRDRVCAALLISSDEYDYVNAMI
jgi:hypothetical protein